MNTVKYYVYSIRYEGINEKKEKEKITEEFYLTKKERDYVFDNGTSKVYINIFPAESKSLFHGWNIPKRCIKSKHTYLCEEPSEERKKTENLTAENYKVKEIKENIENY